ncbi:hypothetical protein T4B_4798 [Trichinella pseudospiralis]|uniref:Uncharacterized protein n=1 Tax=Trichinella pseudospiralis TaxID=6337 RepID=A0A0V1GIE4_TRIPS|nr:hypothetical protein T4B_4798 [Trichinella pseudospiralis]
MICRRFSKSSSYTSLFPINLFKDGNAIFEIIRIHITFPNQSL